MHRLLRKPSGKKHSAQFARISVSRESRLIRLAFFRRRFVVYVFFCTIHA